MTDDGFHRVIKYRGVFDFEGLYTFIVKWLKDRDYDFMERRILDKPPYRIHEMEGRKKVSFMVLYRVMPSIWLWDIKPVEIVDVHGHVKTMTEGRLKIILNGGIIWDYDGDFEKTSMQKKIEAFLQWKILYHENFLKHLDWLDYHVHELMADIKAYLNMESGSNAY